MIIRRTFDALRYPKGSEGRKVMNLDITTSEYSRSQKYIHFSERWGHQTYKTLAEAKEAEQLYIRSTICV